MPEFFSKARPRSRFAMCAAAVPAKGPRRFSPGAGEVNDFLRVFCAALLSLARKQRA
ncbi:hypothetical protein [Desulfovibrio sp. SGI.169]|uniref:hypothetical protein n=1 Tax=Desulfovibrio sp. SGI.169 TaxID=3420561 RepID=UPI003D044F7C